MVVNVCVNIGFEGMKCETGSCSGTPANMANPVYNGTADEKTR